ncbi:PDZ domain-containing protein [Gemmatimonas aurantiaca]|uniref:PDZ domain-containing protein n=1 Tax=Gemmatimonas aurantiaca TaxID=173480 RepID=UPI00301E1237
MKRHDGKRFYGTRDFGARPGARTPVRETRRAAYATALPLLAAAVTFGLPAQVTAQTPPTPQVRVRVTTTTTAMMNACGELASSPSPLVHAPEGLALLRLKRELESAALTLEKQPVPNTEVQRITQVQRGVDSLMRVIVQVQREDGGPWTPGLPRRGDSVRVFFQGNPFEGRMFFEMIDSTARGSVPQLAMPQLAMIIRALQPQVAAVSEAAEARLFSGVAANAGYMGLSLSGAQLRAVTPEGVMTSHCEYPLVESVDAGSPAERAGITAGDTLVAYNGRDVLQVAVNYPELLTPGQPVRVRLRRSGRTRELPVVVGPRKSEERTMVFVRTYGADGAPAGLTASGSPQAGGGGRITMVPRATGASPLPSSAAGVATAQLTTFAGAQFATVDDDFAQALGMDAGVLVLRVPLGTPAADVGLRSGEMVRAVNGTPVRDAITLRRLLGNGGTEVRLLVQAKNSGERVVVMKLR